MIGGLCGVGITSWQMSLSLHQEGEAGDEDGGVGGEIAHKGGGGV